jgi:hypothetical protein
VNVAGHGIDIFFKELKTFFVTGRGSSKEVFTSLDDKEVTMQ